MGTGINGSDKCGFYSLMVSVYRGWFLKIMHNEGFLMCMYKNIVEKSEMQIWIQE